MKKKWALTTAICAVFCLLLCGCAAGDGNTVESREDLIEQGLSKGDGWNIVCELTLDDAIVSGANSADGKAALVLFEPNRGGYSIKSWTIRESDEIIIGGMTVNGDWYDLVWFSGAQTEYAELSYTVDGQTAQPERYETANMEIISRRNSEKEYVLHVEYFDGEGNKFE